MAEARGINFRYAAAANRHRARRDGVRQDVQDIVGVFAEAKGSKAPALNQAQAAATLPDALRRTSGT